MSLQQETVLSSVSQSLPSPQLPASPHAEQRLILHGVSWATYESLLADFQDSHAAFFAYDRGILEIQMPSLEHEKLKHRIATLVELLAIELAIDTEGAGSTTFQREDLARGFEPDACFYVQHAMLVRGKDQIDLSKDPPPDLVIEVDIANLSLNKMPIYAAVGVLEIWRYDRQGLKLFRLEEGEYRQLEESSILPGVTSAQLARFLEESQELTRPEWARRVRDWAQQRKG
jgi:Uma2 family endonuclease